MSRTTRLLGTVHINPRLGAVRYRIMVLGIASLLSMAPVFVCLAFKLRTCKQLTARTGSLSFLSQHCSGMDSSSWCVTAEDSENGPHASMVFPPKPSSAAQHPAWEITVRLQPCDRRLQQLCFSSRGGVLASVDHNNQQAGSHPRSRPSRIQTVGGGPHLPCLAEGTPVPREPLQEQHNADDIAPFVLHVPCHVPAFHVVPFGGSGGDVRQFAQASVVGTEKCGNGAARGDDDDGSFLSWLSFAQRCRCH